MAPHYPSAMSETVTEAESVNPEDNDGLSIKREQTLIQEETVTVKSKRGTGTNDRDVVTKELRRRAELDTDGVDLPHLTDGDDLDKVVNQVAYVMAMARSENND